MPGVLIPFRGGCKHRVRALGWVLNQFATKHPDWQIEVCDIPAADPWSKGKALSQASLPLRHDRLVICDADVWCDGLAEAVAQLDEHEWAVPHKGVFRLSEEATQRVLEGAEMPSDDLEERAYPGTVGGGIVALHTETFRRVPMDPRFEGWGQEDDAWGLALYQLAEYPWRGKTPLYHLWHPPQERISRRIGSVDSKALLRRYGRARTPEDMQALIDEVST